MLKSAHLYKEELLKMQYASWYSLEYQWWNGGSYDDTIELPNSNWNYHKFVSVNKDNEILGYISYEVDHSALKASSFAIISTRQNSVEFAKDLYEVVYNIFFKFNLNKIEFVGYTDNPVMDAYERFINKTGGRLIGIKHATNMLHDHKLHDLKMFEIFKQDFKPLKNWRFKYE